MSNLLLKSADFYLSPSVKITLLKYADYIVKTTCNQTNLQVYECADENEAELTYSTIYDTLTDTERLLDGS